MEIRSIDDQKKVFSDYVDPFIKDANSSDRIKHVDKKQHSLFVLEEAMLVDAIFTQYNPQFANLLALESLFHDIGRFEQLKISGTHRDTDLKDYIPGMKDHGDLGARIMDEQSLLKQLIPDIRLYDEEVKRVIAAHSKPNQDLLNSILKDYINAFRNYDLKELFLSNKSQKERDVLYATNTAIIQDVDRLDIFRKIVKGIWFPLTTKDPIDPEIIELYKKGELPTMAELRAMGKWNPNVGHLVRLSFINQMNLIPVLLKVREEGLIDKVFEANGRPELEDAYEFAKRKLDQAIEDTDDGILRRK